MIPTTRKSCKGSASLREKSTVGTATKPGLGPPMTTTKTTKKIITTTTTMTTMRKRRKRCN